jgi:YVTN family beta-propeller protein
MKVFRLLPIICLVSCGFAQQAPWGRADIPVSAHDRVYAADQTSNTVSVIDPSSNTLLGMIRLGDPVPGALSPLYRGELLVHGLGYPFFPGEVLASIQQLSFRRPLHVVCPPLEKL